MKKYHFPALLALVLLSIVPLSQAQDHYGPVRRGQDLWDIASQVTYQYYQGANVSHTQVMLALLTANPSAFTAPCNANSPLHEGALLTIPTVAQVQALNQEQAQQQFDQQRQQWEEARLSGKPLVCPPVTATPTAPVVQEAPATQAAVPAAKEAPAAVKKSAMATPPVEKPGAKNWLLERQPRVEVELEAVAAALCGILLLVILFWRRFRRKPVVAAAAAPAAPPGEDFAKLSVADTLGKLQTESATGLTAAEAGKRLQDYGPNALEEKKASLWQQVMPFFWGPMPWMIEAAAIMALIVHDWVDFSIILVLLFFNAGLGFFHERAAANALDALKSALAQEALALRDGKWQTLLAKLLVPGDIVRIRLGNVVPADVKLLEGDYLDVDQSALTGESLPVAKKAGDVAYAGSIVKKGEMTAAVFGTGSHTFFGRTAGLVRSAGTKSEFAEANDRIGDFLIILSVSLAVIMVASQLHHGDSFLRIAEFALLLLVAAIPVAMPAVLSMTMAMGAKALAREKVIVSRLDAIEELAGIDILFSDKTGTLTQNKLTLGEPVVWGNATAEDVILAGALASKEEDQDPIDLAVIQALKDPGVLKTYQQVAYVPFDPVAKRTEATIQDSSGQPFKVSKGMPPVIFQLAKMTGDDLAKAEKVVNDFAAKGYRALAAARTDVSGKWVMLGILPMFDPPRSDSKDTIARAQQYGVTVKMVTGDDVAIGQTIAADLGLGGNIVAATDLFTEEVGKGDIPLALARRVDAAQGFGRVFPEHKWAIVKSAQQLVPLRISSYTSLSRQWFPCISPFKRFSQSFVEVVDEVEQPLA